jgi:hypothetical protein
MYECTLAFTPCSSYGHPPRFKYIAVTPSQALSVPATTTPPAQSSQVTIPDAPPRAPLAPHTPVSPRASDALVPVLLPTLPSGPQPLLTANPDLGSDGSQGLDMLREELALASISSVADSMSGPLPPGQDQTTLRLGQPLWIQDATHVASFTYVQSCSCRYPTTRGQSICSEFSHGASTPASGYWHSFPASTYAYPAYPLDHWSLPAPRCPSGCC